MKYHALFAIVEKAAKFEIVICCKLSVALYGLRSGGNPGVSYERHFMQFIYAICVPEKKRA